MRIAFLSSEITPYSKTGGLADVSGALPPALAALGHEVTVISPLFRCVRECGAELMPAIRGIRVPVGAGDRAEPLDAWRAPRHDEVELYFLAHAGFFERPGLYSAGGYDYDDNLERFTFFARGALELLRALTERPEIVHTHDWQAGLAPVYLRTVYAADPLLAGARTAHTIHNLAYQGRFPAASFPATGLPWRHFNWRELEFYDRVNLMKGAIVYADGVSTVSETYAREIQTPEYGFGLDGVLRDRAADLRGIVNGIDVDAWNPQTDPHLPAHYGPDDLSGKAACKRALQEQMKLPVDAHVPLIGLISRLVWQKGIDLLIPCLDAILTRRLQLVILGSGRPEYERRLAAAAARCADRLAVQIGFDEALAHRIEAGADVFLMPSRFEPCGLNQLYSMRYGTVPLVHRTGGLADTVVDATAKNVKNGSATGICFHRPTSVQLLVAVDRALDLFSHREGWLRVVQRGMAQNFSWAARAEKYSRWYDELRSASPRAIGPPVA